MSAAETRLARLPADCIEIAARRGAEASVRSKLPAGCRLLARSRWLLVAEPLPAGRRAAELAAALLGLAAVIDQSSGLVRLRLTGPGATEVLAGACRLDLRPGALAADRAHRTVMAKIPVILYPLADRVGFDLLVQTTLAHAFHHRLDRAVERLAAVSEPPRP